MENPQTFSNVIPMERSEGGISPLAW